MAALGHHAEDNFPARNTWRRLGAESGDTSSDTLTLFLNWHVIIIFGTESNPHLALVPSVFYMYLASVALYLQPCPLI